VGRANRAFGENKGGDGERKKGRDVIIKRELQKVDKNGKCRSARTKEGGEKGVGCGLGKKEDSADQRRNREKPLEES